MFCMDSASPNGRFIEGWDARELLSVTKQQFDRVGPYLLALVLGGGRCRYSSLYIQELQKYTDMYACDAEEVAAKFAAERAAVSVVNKECSNVFIELWQAVCEEAVPVPVIANTIGVGVSTVYGWSREGSLEAHWPSNGISQQHIAVHSVRTFFTWQDPAPSACDPYPPIM